MHLYLRRAASLRTTFALLFTLALLGALGSTIPQGLGPEAYLRLFPSTGSVLLALGFDHYYTGPLYRGLLFLLAGNLAFCSLTRLRRVSDHRRRPRVAFLLVHAAPLAVLAGGLWGSVVGFVGTKNIHVGDRSRTVYCWTSRQEEALPFEIAVDDLAISHYPLQLRLSVGEAAPGAAPVEVREGQVFEIPGTAYRARIDHFEPDGARMTYHLLAPEGAVLGPFSQEEPAPPSLRLVALEYRDPQVRRVEALVSVRSPEGKQLRRDVVAVNEPLAFDGFRIFLTAWGRDANGFPFAGFQVVREPGQLLVWAGAVALTGGLILLLFGRSRARAGVPKAGEDPS